jgi:class 3 adenylate cyclase
MTVSRRLVAVFAADVEGYSRLMGADEVATLKGLTERRAILDRIIGEHGGRIANTAGDSVLAEFGSAVEAEECAVKVQAPLCRQPTLGDARRSVQLGSDWPAKPPNLKPGMSAIENRRSTGTRPMVVRLTDARTWCGGPPLTA